MFSKIEVNGDGAAPLYQWLRSEQPGAGDSSDIGWNFAKFLVDQSGTVVKRFEPTVTPADIDADIAALL
jgi:glutathione peroxidase